MAGPEAVQGQAIETNVIPSLSVSERYDSNVYFVPGGDLQDYVTNFSPQLKVIHKRRLVEATIGGGFTAESYVKNPGLNYAAGNGLMDLNLDGAVSEVVRGLGLHLSNTFYYTPQPPSFAAPTGGGQIPESFVRGIQAQRANSFTNAGKAEWSYAVSPVLSFTSTYGDQRMRFSNTMAPARTGVAQGRFYNSVFQTITSGPLVKVSPVDTVTLTHQYQKGEFDLGGSGSGFSTQGATAGWTRLLTPTLTVSVMGGATVFSQTNDLQYLGSMSLAWKGPEVDLSLSYSRVIAPGFFIVATPLLSQMVAMTATYRMSESLSVSILGNYAVSESVPDRSLMKYESYTVTPSVNYQMSRVVTATLSYAHSVFESTSSSQIFNFSRDMVMLRMVAEWK